MDLEYLNTGFGLKNTSVIIILSDYVDVMLYLKLRLLDVTSVRTLGSTVVSSNTFRRKERPFLLFDVSKQELHAIHMMAWKQEVKTLYYLRSEAIKRAETVSDEALRQYMFDSIDEGACLACEG